MMPGTRRVNSADLTIDQLSTVRLQAAKEYWQRQPSERKTEYKSQRMWALLEQKWQAIERQQ